MSSKEEKIMWFKTKGEENPIKIAEIKMCAVVKMKKVSTLATECVISWKMKALYKNQDYKKGRFE